jgi:hypothetical protein
MHAAVVTLTAAQPETAVLDIHFVADVILQLVVLTLLADHDVPLRGIETLSFEFIAPYKPPAGTRRRTAGLRCGIVLRAHRDLAGRFRFLFGREGPADQEDNEGECDSATQRTHTNSFIRSTTVLKPSRNERERDVEHGDK